MLEDRRQVKANVLVFLDYEECVLLSGCTPPAAEHNGVSADDWITKTRWQLLAAQKDEPVCVCKPL